MTSLLFESEKSIVGRVLSNDPLGPRKLLPATRGLIVGLHVRSRQCDSNDIDGQSTGGAFGSTAPADSSFKESFREILIACTLVSIIDYVYNST
jgi:hypothetical protein